MPKPCGLAAGKRSHLTQKKDWKAISFPPSGATSIPSKASAKEVVEATIVVTIFGGIIARMKLDPCSYLLLICKA